MLLHRPVGLLEQVAPHMSHTIRINPQEMPIKCGVVNLAAREPTEKAEPSELESARLPLCPEAECGCNLVCHRFCDWRCHSIPDLPPLNCF